MKWFDLAVCPKFSWPNSLIEIPFEGHTLVLQPRRGGVPEEMELAATVSVFDPNGVSFEVGGTVASRFLSRLAWSNNGGAVELFSSGSNFPDRPGRLGQGYFPSSGWAQVRPWDLIYLPAAQGRDADLALGLFREGLSVNSLPFAFLSYFKVLNIVHGGGKAQTAWINSHLHAIQYPPALERLRDLQKREPDVGKYLYEAGRCAVAHAHGTPLVNPDSYVDRRRMEDDLRLVKELAALFIEKELGVLSDSSYWERLGSDKSLESDLLQKVVQEDGRIVYKPYESR
ncbi:methylamine utilization protein MauJ [Duganella sp. P38]|uniref:methylamine utilization protein MauJ n=1 Tax=Duganella sp. P38 TaxID=3423949 RepID=UPI003D7A734E